MITNDKNILQYTGQEISALIQTENFNNFFGRIDIECELERLPIYLEYYSKSSFLLKSINDYIDFLFLWKQTNYKKAIYLIKEDKKEDFKASYDKIDSLFKNYKVKDAIAFINNYYCTICENPAITSLTFKYIKDKMNGIRKDVLIEIAKKQPFVFYQNLKNEIGYIKSNAEILDILLNQEIFTEMIKGMPNLIYKCLLELNKHRELKEYVKRGMNLIIEYMETIEESVSQTNIFETRFVYNDYCEFLKAIKSPRYLDKKKKLDEYESLLQKEISEQGHAVSLCMTGDEIEKHFEKMDPQYELLTFTHTLDRINNRVVSRFEEIMKSNEVHLTDLFICNERSNEYLTTSKQITIQHLMFICRSCITQYLVNVGRLQTFFEIIKYIIKDVCNKTSIGYHEKGFEDDINIVGIAVFNLFQEKLKTQNENMLQMLSYTTITYICSLIEKLLREIYIAENHETKFIDLQGITIGDLLNVNNNVIITNILGYAQTRCIRFLLHKDDNEVGENIRNNFAHLKNITAKDYTLETAMKVLWLFLSVANSLALYYLGDANSTAVD